MRDEGLDRISDDEMFHDWLKQLVDVFRSGSGNCREWRHPERLALIGWFLLNYPEHEAVGRLSQRFRELEYFDNGQGHAHYHETCFVFWVIVVRRFLRTQTEPGSQLKRLQSLLRALSGEEELPLRYYSELRWQSCKARYEWIAPDKREIGDTMF